MSCELAGDETLNIVIREAEVSDALGIINILNPIIEEGRFTILDKTFSLKEEEAFIRQFPTRGVFQVAVLEKCNTVVGFQNVEPFATYTQVTSRC
ncbi:hypothetical protein [Vibrio sp. vnigr-6D03]|uniref:GNAT family N-acetyltransferase n=1 Tax=Vibrio sp. vnigr-6D03 TaxID=2058088 RepID=UPI0015E1599A|nr:hypothetical protein [Vibrio sp. vnigr-6D03]